MIAQSTTRPSTQSPLTGVIAKSKEVAGDFIELTELQIRLARADWDEFVKSSVPGIVIAIIGAVVGVASLPLILFGLATLIATLSGLQLWVAQLIVGTAALLIAAVMLSISTLRLRRSLQSFQTSTAQLVKNADWLKSIIRER